MTKEAPQVLVVEDDLHLRGMVKIQLEKLGCHVSDTGHVKEALELARHADLVVLDLKLVEPDGKEILKRLRDEKNFVPTIVMSGYPELQLEMEALEIVYWLDKPFGLRAFTDVAKKALGTVTNIESLKDCDTRLGSWLMRQERKHGMNL